MLVTLKARTGRTSSTIPISPNPNAGDIGRPRFDAWVDDPLEKESNILVLGKPMDRGAWWATVQGVKKSQTRLGTTASPK